MKFRNGKDKWSDTPGVGAYDIDRKKRGGITMGWRHDTKSKESIPGPSDYVGEYKRISQSAPCYSMSWRPNLKPREVTPGPG